MNASTSKWVALNDAGEKLYCAATCCGCCGCPWTKGYETVELDQRGLTFAAIIMEMRCP